MKNFNFLTRLAGLALVGLTSIFGWGAPAPPVLRTPMTTNSSTGAPVNGDVPTFDLATQKWTFAAPPGASGGEANVGANDGAGAGVYANKVGITLHFNTLTNGNSYLTISSNASLLTLSVVGLQPTNNNLTLLSAFGPTTWQATNANLTLLQAFGPTTWQATNAALTALAGNPSLYQATNANLTLLQAYGPTTWQSTNSTLTRVAGIGSGASGDILYRDATGWTNLVKGANDKVLKLKSGLPSWETDETSAGGETSGTVHAPDGATTANRIALFKDATGTNITQSANFVYDFQHTNTTLTRLQEIGAGTSGDILYRDATGWTNLAKSTDGKVLELSGGFPSWQTPAAGGATNIDYGSANTYTISNSLSVLGTMTLSELDVAEIIVTNNVQGSNLIANVAVITPKVQATNGANLVLAVNTTNVATAAGSSGVMDFVKTPTVGGNPVLTNAPAGTGSTNITDNGYVAEIRNVTVATNLLTPSLTLTGAGTSIVINASVNVATNVTALNFIATNQLYSFGSVEASQYMIVGPTYSYRFTGRGRIQSPSDGVVRAAFDDSTTMGTWQGNLTSGTIDNTNTLHLQNLTPSKVLLSDGSSYVTNSTLGIADLAPVSSPTFTGTATIPTAAVATLTVGSETKTNSTTFPLTTSWSVHSAGSNYVVDVSLPRLHFNMTTNLNIIHATNGTANFTANTAMECGIKVINNSGTNFPVSFPSTWKCYGNAVSNHICWLTNGDWLTMAIQFAGPSTSQTNIDAAVAYRSPGT